MGRNGGIVAHYEYSPFGSLTKLSGDYAASNPFRFSSEYFDEETALVYYNYRYYNPELGRWISRDPIEEQGGYNLYGMIGNNPLYGWDDLGRSYTLKVCLACAGDVAIPEPSDILPYKWAAWLAAIGGAVIVDGVIITAHYIRGERRKAAKPDGTGNPDKAKRKTRDHQTGKKLPPKKAPKPPPPEPELIPKRRKK